MTFGRLRGHTLAVFVVVLASVLALPPAWSADPASWGGRVFGDDGITPRSGVVVKLLDAQGRATVESGPTHDNGGFVIDNAPSGDYTVAVETAEGVFLSPATLNLQPGVNTPHALRTGPMNAELEYGLGGEGGLSTLTQWIIAGAVGLVALLVVYNASQGEDGFEPDESPTVVEDDD